MPSATLDRANAAKVVDSTLGWPPPRLLWIVVTILLKNRSASTSIELRAGGGHTRATHREDCL